MTIAARHSLVAFALATTVGLVAVTQQSLWIDEANSAVKATRETFCDFIEAMRQERGSDLQMPLYMLMLWAWEKVFGPSEFALRAMNIPLFASAIAMVVALLHRPLIERVFFAVFAICSPFIWAYLDEARPYMLQFFGGVLCMVPLANLTFNKSERSGPDVFLFAIGVVVLCGSSLLGVIFALCFGAWFLYVLARIQQLPLVIHRKDWLIVALVCIPVLAALGTYYAWTLSVGARASGVGSTTPASTVFAVYELLGFSGLGPSRSSLREAPAEALTTHLSALLLYGALLLSFAATAVVDLLRRQSCNVTQVAFWVAPVLATAAVLMLGVLTGFRVLGRHCMPILPFVFLALAMAASIVWRGQRRVAGRALVVVLLLAMSSSALSYRFLHRHAKDDYRAAAEEARKTIDSSGVVWWAADLMGGKYYGLLPQLALSAKTVAANVGGVFMANSRSEKYLAELPSPDLIVVSKRDIYDREGVLEEWIRTHGFRRAARRPGFEFYTAIPPSE